MRFLFFVLFVSFFAVACQMQSANQGTNISSAPAVSTIGGRAPVLVELFTSEGCSSCPPADRNLAFLDSQQPVANAEIITLAFHVDYWDRLGWKDRFSSAEYSRRQESYAHAFKLSSNYTPQMIVDGSKEFVGSDSAKASTEIASAAESSKASVEVSVNAGRVNVKIAGVPQHKAATLYAAIAEDGISTRVGAGENSGKTLEHSSVVRELKTLGEVAADKGEFESTFDVALNPEWKEENSKVVIFVQERDSRKIIAVGRAKLGGK